MMKTNGRQMAGQKNAQKKRAPLTMVPLFSRRSITVLGIGLLVGAIVGVGYWYLSPSLSSAFGDMGKGGLTQAIGTPSAGPYQSTVTIQLVNPGSSYMPLNVLQQRAEYYAGKANSLPFREFLTRQLAELAPEYSHTMVELEKIVKISYNWKSLFPAMEIQATAPTSNETMFLVSVVPKVFENYLITEEKKVWQESQQSDVTELQRVTETLLQARKEMTALALQVAQDDMNSDPQYVALSSQAEALKIQLDLKAQELAVLTSLGDTSSTYAETEVAVRRAGEALAKVRRELALLKAQANQAQLSSSLGYEIAKTRVDNLNTRLASLMQKTGLSINDNTLASQVSDYLAIGSPSRPVPVLPERLLARNTIMMGSVLGMGAAWALLNLAWLVSGMPARKDEEEKEKEEA